MEKQTLPNSTLILIFGILSILTCCCYGILGLLFGVIALILAGKAKRTYLADPELYDGYGNVKTGRILAIIGVILSAIFLIMVIIAVSIHGVEGLLEISEEMRREYEN
ncbi:CCC motif membrane protein [Salinimicrobium flavum]|uniref:CCC motif membrane protein n=1 Tax=Salinimicrobium flavum TaxID=1737065 RepID=A0ABW5J0P6_9FLAO